MPLRFVARNTQEKRILWFLLISFYCSGVVICFIHDIPTRKHSNAQICTSSAPVDRLNYCERKCGTRKRTTTLFVSSSMDSSWARQASDPLVLEIESIKDKSLRSLRGGNYTDSLLEIKRMTSFVRRKTRKGSQKHKAMSAVVDETIRAFTDRAFANPYPSRSGRRRIRQGVEALNLQLSPKNLAAPYNTVPRHVLLNALKALTKTISKDEENNLRRHGEGFSSADSSFRILQRLVTGVGVRFTSQKQRESFHVLERDFNMVLQAFSNIGRMDMAHKTVALQERTEHAQPLSPVAYSIMLKGYGRLGDLENVEMTTAHACNKGVEPDTVMLNSLIDACINCNALDMAKDVFKMMNDREYVGDSSAKHTELLRSKARPRPNVRTYNILLNGLAKAGACREAMDISAQMRKAQMWDHVTTNTLAKAAVNAEEFQIAEDLLTNYTARMDASAKRRQHPNVEAYTDLLDGYAKAGMLDRSSATLQLMHKRGVEPTIVTYTCMVGNLAKAKKINLADGMLDFMQSIGMPPKVVTYNAFISGLVSDPPAPHSDATKSAGSVDSDEFNIHVDEAVMVLKRMLKSGVKPNSITVSVLIDAFRRCEPPRLNEAKAFVAKLDNDGIVSAEDNKVGTAMIHCYAAAGDLKGALQVFRNMRNPDVIALNAFMDACCQCNQLKLAIDSFVHFFGNQGRLVPDVVTYSILISALLKRNNAMSSEKARQLYFDMREKRITPDTALVDVVLNAMLRSGRLGLRRREIEFVLKVLRDAERLTWATGQLERRKRAVRGALAGRMKDAWKQDKELYSFVSEDDLLARKGWNTVDSGFRLWGGTDELQSKEEPSEVDEFLASKGWNDVDSGFRII